MYGNVDVKDFVKDVNIFLYKDTKIHYIYILLYDVTLIGFRTATKYPNS